MKLTQIAGRRVVEYVAKSDTLLVIRFEDGNEVQVAWVDESGNPVKGEPVAQFVGKRIIAKPQWIER